VVERAQADPLVWIAQASESIVVISEEVGVDGADSDALGLCELPELAVIGDGVPGDVKSDARAASSQAVHESRVRDPLLDVPGGAGPWIDVESRPRVAVSP
jgi:hypothetical protein